MLYPCGLRTENLPTCEPADDTVAPSVDEYQHVICLLLLLSCDAARVAFSLAAVGQTCVVISVIQSR